MSWGMKKSRTANICDDWCVLIEEDIIWLTFKTNIKHIPFSESGSGPPVFWVYKEAFFPPSLRYTKRKWSLLPAVTIPIMRTQQTFTGPLLDSVGVSLIPRLKWWIMMTERKAKVVWRRLVWLRQSSSWGSWWVRWWRSRGSGPLRHPWAPTRSSWPAVCPAPLWCNRGGRQRRQKWFSVDNAQYNGNVKTKLIDRLSPVSNELLDGTSWFL